MIDPSLFAIRDWNFGPVLSSAVPAAFFSLRLSFFSLRLALRAGDSCFQF
jgi:hypothetical protein